MIYEIKRGNTILASVHATGSQIVDVMQQDRVTMAFVLPAPVDFKRGDKVNVYGQTYQLNRPDNRAKTNNTLGFEYDLEFEAQYYDLAKWQLKGLDKNNELTLSEVFVTGTASVIVDLLVRNANRVDFGWTMGIVDETETEHFTYVNQSLLAVLIDLASRFDTEFWVDNKTIHLQKREQSTGLTLSWGKDNGLYELFRGRTDKSVINRLYVEGGTRNLPEGYGFPRLQLPEASRPYLQVPIPPNETVIEHTLFFENIFPSRTGTVTALGENELIIIDDTLDFDINDCKVDGLEFKVAFTSGQLAFVDSFVIDKYDHATKAITLTRIDDDKAYPDGIPSELLRPAIGDKYVLLDLDLPPSYVVDNQNKLLAAGSAYLEDNKDDKHEYSANLTPIWVKETNPNIRLGYTVRILEPDLNIDKELRIAGYVRDLQESALYTDFKLGEKLKPSEIMRQYAQQERILYAIQTSGLLDPENMRKNLFLNRLSERNGYLMLGSEKVKAGNADNAERWNGLLQPDYLDQPVRKEDTVNFEGVSSMPFNTGFQGIGYAMRKLANGKYELEVDRLRVREQMFVYELVINQLRATNGTLVVTDSAKGESVISLGNNKYRVKVDTDQNRVTFFPDDVVRAQRFNGRDIKYYQGVVSNVQADSFDVTVTDGAGFPEAGDEIVRITNLTNPDRMGTIELDSSNGLPRMSFYYGQLGTDRLFFRSGDLSDIVSLTFGQLEGSGTYAKRGYFEDVDVSGRITVTGGNAATKVYAEEQSNIAKLDAVNLAASDATSKDNALKAVVQGYADDVALSQANVAKAAAISAASMDAQSKADAARVLAENMAQQLVDGVAAAIADADQKAVAAQNAYNTLTGQLKSMAYKDVVALADLGTTVIEGGKLTNTLIDTNYIKTNVINAGYINSLDIAAKRIVIGGTAQDPKSYVEGMINNIQVGGVNLLTNTDRDWAGGNEYGVYERSNELSEIYSKGEITISFDIRFPVVTNGSCQVYSANPINGNPRYSFSASVNGVSTEWQRKKVTVTPVLYTTTSQHSNLEFYATYGTGQIPHIRNVKIEVGNVATDWTLAPQEQWSGGRNLLIGSGGVITTSNYMMANYTLSEPITPGESCVLTIRGNLGAGKTFFGAYTNGGSVNQAVLSMTYPGVYRAYFKWKASDSNFIIYQLYNDVTSTSTISSIKLERGTMASDWTPANEDFKSLAYKDAVALADLGTTVIQGGKLTNSLIDTNYIRTNIINAAYMETLEFVARNVTITGNSKVAGFNMDAEGFSHNGAGTYGSFKLTPMTFRMIYNGIVNTSIIRSAVFEHVDTAKPVLELVSFRTGGSNPNNGTALSILGGIQIRTSYVGGQTYDGYTGTFKDVNGVTWRVQSGIIVGTV